MERLSARGGMVVGVPGLKTAGVQKLFKGKWLCNYVYYIYSCFILLISCLYINIIADTNKKRVAKRKREGDTKEDGKKVKLEVKGKVV